MIIEDKRELDYIEFSRLDPGDVFMAGGLFFVVLDYEYNATGFTAVEVDTGGLNRFEGDNEVIPVNAKVVIE